MRLIRWSRLLLWFLRLAGCERKGVLAGRAQEARERDDVGRGARRRRRRRRREFEHALEAVHVEHLDRERGRARLLDARVAVAFGESEQRVDAAHARPGQRPLKERVSEAADRLTVLFRLRLEEGEVAHRVRRLVLGVIARVDRLAAGRLAGVHLDDGDALVEAHRAAVGARAQTLADVTRGQGVESFRDLRALVARDERLAPERYVVLLSRRRQESRFLLGLELLERHALRARVTTAAILV